MNRTQSKAQNRTQPARAAKENCILDRNVNLALRELVAISKKLVTLAESETQALVCGDMLRFACVQQDKESLAVRYAKASEEFRSRLEEFRSADKALLNQLSKLQDDLKQKTNDNNVMIQSIKKRSQAKTQSTLFSVQELAQRTPVNIHQNRNTQAGDVA